MNIKLNKIECENFKGFPFFSEDLGGRNAVVTGENETGKTSLADIFTWTFFGKDTLGRADIEHFWPKDKITHEPINDVILKTQIGLSIDDDKHIFRRELHEKVVKGQIRGYQTFCWIDDVAKKISDYNDTINEIIPEETFKLLTDLAYFNTKIKWPDRRKFLMELVGKVDVPTGYATLLSQLNGRTVDQFKSVLVDQKKLDEKERDDIPPRIDELHKGLASYIPDFQPDLELQCDSLKFAVISFTEQRDKLLSSEKARQKILNDINNYEVQKRKREVDLENDTSAVKSLLDEKVQIQKDIFDKKVAYKKLESQLSLVDISIEGAKETVQQERRKVQEYRDELHNLNLSEGVQNCFACGQALPADKLAENRQKHQAKIDEVQKSASKHQQVADKCEETNKTLQDQRDIDIANMQVHFKDLEENRKRDEWQIANIDQVIENRPKPDPTQDKIWQEIDAKIDALQNELGDPVAVQLQNIEQSRSKAEAELTEINKALAQSDRANKDKTRITELGDREKVLSQKIADGNKKIDEIKRFKAEQSRMIETAVNGLFKHTTFKLFKCYLNGDTEDTCVAILDNGVPYPDMSTGRQICIGVDIINTLSQHYDLSVPLFVDHAESLTLPLEANSQVIRLFARLGVKTLQVETIPVKGKAKIA